MLLKGFNLFVFLLLIAGCTPERNNPLDPMGQEVEWINVERPEAITILPDGNLCVANRNRFTIFTPEGDSIDCFFSTGTVVDLEVGFNRILTTAGTRLMLFDLIGTFQSFKDNYEFNGNLYYFTNLTGLFADKNYLYLIDSNKVIKMGSNFECLARWESFDSRTLYDIFCSKGYLYATMKDSIGIQVFDTSGNFIKEKILEGTYGGDKYISEGITGDKAGNLFFFSYSLYYSTVDSVYYINDSWICIVKEMQYDGKSGKIRQESDLLDIVYNDGYLYVTEYWDNNVRKLWLDGYIP